MGIMETMNTPLSLISTKSSVLFSSKHFTFKNKIHAKTVHGVSIWSLLDKYPHWRVGKRTKRAPRIVGAQNCGFCIWCKMIFQEKKMVGEVLEWIREVKRNSKVCVHCNVNSVKKTGCVSYALKTPIYSTNTTNFFI